MQTENFIKKLLDYGKCWEVTKVEFSEKNENEIDIFVKYIPQEGEIIYDYRELRRWRHLDILQYKSFINCRMPRIKNKDGKVTTIDVSWANKLDRHTFLFEERVILTLLATKKQTKTSQLLNCDFHVVNRIMHRATERGLMRREKDEEFKFIGIDEKSFKKGHDYVTILTSQDKGIVIDICRGRDYKSCSQLIDKALTEEQVSKVQSISMDMWKPYLSIYTNYFPCSLLIHDRFHLVKYLNDAVDKVRRREVKTNEELKSTKYLWLKNQSNFSEKQKEKFELIDRANIEVAKAWQVKENFKMIFGNQYLEQAYDLFISWLQSAYKVCISEITKVTKMFANHSIGILNALFCNQSNAIAERMNGKVQEIKICGRGYRRFDNFRSAILFFNGGLNLLPQGSQ